MTKPSETDGRAPDGRFKPGQSGNPETQWGPDNPPPSSPGRPKKDAFVYELEQRLEEKPEIRQALADMLLKMALKGGEATRLKALDMIQSRVGGPVKQVVEAQVTNEARRIVIVSSSVDPPQCLRASCRWSRCGWRRRTRRRCGASRRADALAARGAASSGASLRHRSSSLASDQSKWAGGPCKTTGPRERASLPWYAVAARNAAARRGMRRNPTAAAEGRPRRRAPLGSPHLLDPIHADHVTGSAGSAWTASRSGSTTERAG